MKRRAFFKILGSLFCFPKDICSDTHRRFKARNGVATYGGKDCDYHEGELQVWADDTDGSRGTILECYPPRERK